MSSTSVSCDVCCGSGGGGGTISVPCCPSNLLPATVTATFSGGTGTCACLNGLAVSLTWDGAQWTGGSIPLVQCSNGPWPMSLKCFTVISNRWGLIFCGHESDKTTWSCAPLSIVFSVTLPPVGCPCSDTVTVTITP